MPSMNIFDEQSAEYREEILPKNVCCRLAVEAGTSFGWAKYIGLAGATVTVDKWGASAPANIGLPEYGFTVENVVKTYKEMKENCPKDCC